MMEGGECSDLGSAERLLHLLRCEEGTLTISLHS